MAEISVVIPLYNKEPYIKRAISSVLSQTFTDFELIVVDDGSTDNSANMARGFSDARVRVITQKNAGVSAARNSGIAEAKTELVAFLDADDEYKPHFLETIMRLRKNFPQAGAFGTAYETALPNGKIRKPKLYAVPSAPWEGLMPNYFESALSYPFCSSSVAVLKSTFEKAGYFPEGEMAGEDLDIWARTAVKVPICFSNSIAAVYHTEHSAQPAFNDDRGMNLIKTLEKLQNEIGTENEDFIYLKEYTERHKIIAAIRYLSAGKKLKARELLRTVKTKIFRKEKLYWLLCSYAPNFSIPVFIGLKTMIRSVYR